MGIPKLKRSFKIIDINGKPGKETTYYRSTTAIGAASKMFSLYARVTGEKKGVITLKEITKDGSGKTSTYVAKRVRSKSDWKPEGGRPAPKYTNIVKSGSKLSRLESGWHDG